MDPLFSVWPAQPNTYYVNSVAASSDGQRLVAGTFFKTYATARRIEPPAPRPNAVADDPQAGTFGVYAYDRTGTLCWSDTYSGWQGIFWVDAAAAAPVCAAGGWFTNTPAYQGVVRAYDLDTGNRLLDDRTGSRVNQVSLSADGSLLLCAADTLRLYQRSGDSFSLLGSPMLAQDGDSVVTAFLAGNGATAVCATLKRGIFVFTVGDTGLTQTANWSWPASSGCCHSVVLNHAGTRFAAGGSGGIYALFDVATLQETSKPILECTAPNKAVVYSVAIAETGDEFAAVANVTGTGTKGLVLCHKAVSATPAWSYATTNCPNRVVLNSAHSLLAVADGYPDGCPGIFYILGADDGREIGRYTSGNMSWGIAISADGTLVAGGSDDARAYGFSPTS